jgi:hypothetical protein
MYHLLCVPFGLKTKATTIVIIAMLMIKAASNHPIVSRRIILYKKIDLTIDIFQSEIYLRFVYVLF